MPDDEISVVVLRTEELAPEVRAAIVAICIAAHESEEFGKLFSHFSSGGRHFLAYRERELVSHAVVTTRWLAPEGSTALRTGYVDAVSTHPRVQGKGAGSAVMRRLGTEIGDYRVGCLQTDLVGFYERTGWEPWRGPLAGRRGGELVPTPDQRGVMVLRTPSTPELDLDAGLSIECQPYRIWE